MYLPADIPVPPQAQYDPEDVRGGFRSPGVLEVRATESDLTDALASAVDVVSRAADEYRTGILISRIGTERYIVRAHPGVPYGMIRESYG